jgi:hypothetical protein
VHRPLSAKIRFGIGIKSKCAAKARQREERRGADFRIEFFASFFIDILKFFVLLERLCADNSRRRNFTGMNRMNRIRLAFED